MNAKKLYSHFDLIILDKLLFKGTEGSFPSTLGVGSNKTFFCLRAGATK